jgi:hypothetical protein
MCDEVAAAVLTDGSLLFDEFCAKWTFFHPFAQPALFNPGQVRAQEQGNGQRYNKKECPESPPDGKAVPLVPGDGGGNQSNQAADQ